MQNCFRSLLVILKTLTLCGIKDLLIKLFKGGGPAISN